MLTERQRDAVESANPPARLVFTVEEAARHLGIGRTLMYSLVMSGQVESVTIGRLRRIPIECLADYIGRLRTNGHPDLPTTVDAA